MRYKALTYLFFAAFATALPEVASAQITDAADKVLKTMEGVAAESSLAYKMVSATEDGVNKVKTGDLGINLAPFTELKNSFITKKVEPFALPSYTQDENNMSEAIGDALMPVYGQGSDTLASQQQSLNNLLVQQNNAATLYSRALAMRVALAEEYKKTPPEIDFQDGMAVLQATKAYAEQINQRIANIATLDASISDLDNSRNLIGQGYYNMLARDKEGNADTSGDKI